MAEEQLHPTKDFWDFFSHLSTMRYADQMASIDLLLNASPGNGLDADPTRAGFQRAYCHLRDYYFTDRKESASAAAALFTDAWQRDSNNALLDTSFGSAFGKDWLHESILLSLIYTKQTEEALRFAKEMAERDPNYKTIFRHAYMQLRYGSQYLATDIADEAAEHLLSDGDMGYFNIRTRDYDKLHSISRNALFLGDVRVRERLEDLAKDPSHLQDTQNNLVYLLLIYSLLRKYDLKDEAQLFLDDTGFCELADSQNQWLLLRFYERGMQRTLAHTRRELIDLGSKIPVLVGELRDLWAAKHAVWEEYYAFERDHPECFPFPGKVMVVRSSTDLALYKVTLEGSIDSNKEQRYTVTGEINLISELMRQAGLIVPQEAFAEFMFN